MSIADASVAVLAEQTNDAILLTGDGRLRKKSIAQGIEVKGTLWVLDKLFEEESISADQAIAALQNIMNGGTFLPQEKCAELLDLWDSQR